MKILYTALFLLSVNVSFAQFQLNGSASIVGVNNYQLTPASPSSFGAIWNKLQHDLNKPFVVQGTINLGSDPIGADGICFVMQNSCLAAGGAGGGLGYVNMPGQSMAIEFDTYQNILGTGVELNQDPLFDHIAVEKNGNVVHDGSANALTPAIQMDPVLTNVKNGTAFPFKITYNPTTNLLEVYFNGSLRISLNYDIKTTIFGGNQWVYWGFTASTGGQSNNQQVYIDVANSTHVFRDTSICSGSIPIDLNPFTNLRGANVALNNPVVSSSDFAGNVASLAVNGSLFSRWESVQGVDPQWIYVDLQSPTDVDSVVLYWEGAYADGYSIETSFDAISWTPVYSTTIGDGGKDKIIFSASNVRYVRMNGTHRATIYGYSLWEFQVYGLPKYLWSPNNGSITPNIYSASVILTPLSTTSYSLLIPDACVGFTTATFTVTKTCVLPFDFIDLNLKSTNQGVKLDWNYKEKSPGYFKILKSKDGVNFNFIGSVSSYALESETSNYQYNDLEINEGVVYYKVQYQKDGGERIESSIKEITYYSSLPYLTSPIFDNETELIIPSSKEDISYVIYNVLGQKVEYKSIGSNTLRFKLGKEIRPASYILVVSLNGEVSTFKMIKTL